MVSAVVGAAGLEPTLAAVKAGKRVAIANKEPLVMAGHLFTKPPRAQRRSILPVDSEHCAVVSVCGRVAPARCGGSS